MSNAPLMPKATAVWLVDNTALTFDQVADFTKMHPLEVRAPHGVVGDQMVVHDRVRRRPGHRWTPRSAVEGAARRGGTASGRRR